MGETEEFAGGGFFEAKESPSRTHPKKAILEITDCHRISACASETEHVTALLKELFL